MRLESWKELEPVMEAPWLFLDVHVNILLSVKITTVIFSNHHWKVQKQCISGTNLGAIANGNSGTSFITARTLMEEGVGSICFQVTISTFPYSYCSQGLERDLAENRLNYCLHTCVETKLNPFQAFGFIKAETHNSLFKTDLRLWLSSTVQIIPAAHTLDISSQESQCYFLNTWMVRNSLAPANQQYTLRLFSMK